MGRVGHHTPEYVDAVGQFGLPYHLEMVRDRERVGVIKRAIRGALQDKPGAVWTCNKKVNKEIRVKLRVSTN